MCSGTGTVQHVRPEVGHHLEHLDDPVRAQLAMEPWLPPSSAFADMRGVMPKLNL